jgi:MFS family permease
MSVTPPSGAQPASTQGLAVLGQRNFPLYLAARVIATIAVQMQSVAIGWQVYAATGKLFDLGLIGLAQFAPFLVFILPAGQVADRYDRRRILMLCFGLQLACAAFLLVLSSSGLAVVWPVFLALTLFGTARAFSMPASQAILLNIVAPEHFGPAVALASSSFHVAVILGPVLGGLLYIAGPTVVYVIVIALLLLALGLMARVRSAQAPSPKTQPSLGTLLEGIRFVWSRPVVLGAISLDLFAVLFGGAVALLPAYARDILHADSTGLGLLRAAPGAGAALTSLVLAYRPLSRHVGVWMFGGVAVFGLATVLLGQTQHFAVALGALFLTGAGDMVSVYVRHVLVQFETPDVIRGRVSAVNAVFIGASNELGEFESGLMAAWLGLVPAIVVGGVLTVLVTLIWSWRFPVLSRMDRFPHLREAGGSPELGAEQPATATPGTS